MAIKFHAQGVKELLLKAGRSTEKATFKRLLKKYPGSGVKAYKVAQQKGLRKTFALGQKMGVEGLGVRAGIKKITKFKNLYNLIFYCLLVVETAGKRELYSRGVFFRFYFFVWRRTTLYTA